MAERRIPWWLRKKDDTLKPAQTAADYTVVSTISTKFLRLLQDNLVPKLLQSRDNIGICTPNEHPDITLGIYLYDIQESKEARVSGFQAVDQQYQQYPPMYLELYYMVTTYLSIDLRYRSEEEHRLLGGVMQLLYDNPMLCGDEGEEEILLALENYSVEEKMKLWNGFGTPYRLSLFYKVAPVKLESTLFKKITRVKEVNVEIFDGGNE